MKKCFLVLFALVLGLPLFAQIQLPEHYYASGNWSFIGARLYQMDVRAPLAKMNIRVPQEGPMLYEFNARYESGAEDGHAGFGIHIFADSSFPRQSWGSGQSYLLWLNYDENPSNPDIPKGFSTQIYKSVSHSSMELVESIDLNRYSALITQENLASPLPIKIYMNNKNGEVRVYDPTNPVEYMRFYLDKNAIPTRASWVALRTNGGKFSFGM